MDRPPTFGFNFESASDEEDLHSSSTDQARKIGAFTRNTLGKPTQKEKDKEDEEKAKKEQAEASKKEEKAQPKKPEKVEKPRIEALKRRALKEQLEVNIPKLEADLAAAEPHTPQHAAVLAALSVETRLKQKIENPDALADPLIDEEFDRRMADLPESEVELLEIIGEDIPSLPELPTDEAEPEEVTALPTIPLVVQSKPNISTESTVQETTPTGPTHSGGSEDYDGYSPSATDTSETTRITPLPTQPRSVERTPEKTTKARSFADSGLFEKLVTRENTPTERPPSIQPERVSSAPEMTKRHLINREEELKQAVEAAVAESAHKTREVGSNTVARTPVAEILRQTITSPSTETSVAQKSASPESSSPQKPEASTDTTERQPTRKNESIVKNIEQLSTPQILRAAESIVIGGISVRKLYETNQIDRKGLVYIVKEKLRGRNVKQALKKVELGRERQKERAIEMRHDDPGFVGTSSDIQSASTPLAPITNPVLPNVPDPTSMQPISSETAATATTAQATTQNPVSSNSGKKKGYAVNIAIIIAGIALLLAWVFL